MTGRCARRPSSAPPGCRTLGLRLPLAYGPLVKLSPMWGVSAKVGADILLVPTCIPAVACSTFVLWCIWATVPVWVWAAPLC